MVSTSQPSPQVPSLLLPSCAVDSIAPVIPDCPLAPVDPVVPVALVAPEQAHIEVLAQSVGGFGLLGIS